MRIHPLFSPRLGSAALLCLVVILGNSCALKPDPIKRSSNKQSSSKPTDPTTAQPEVSTEEQIQAAVASFNEQPSYELTAEDVALLQSQGILEQEDPAVLQQLVAKK